MFLETLRILGLYVRKGSVILSFKLVPVLSVCGQF